MCRPADLTNHRFGRLVAKKCVRSSSQGRVWRCVCDCGNEVEVVVGELRRGNNKSCGCLNRDNAVAKCRARRTHGMTHGPEHRCWSAMIQRCHNPNNQDFGRYGGRGIVVCDRWRASFADFFADMGSRPSKAHTLDRIENNRGYEPGNVRWAVKRVQMNNTRGNRRVAAYGAARTVAEWAVLTGVHPDRIYKRLNRGVSPELAIVF